MHQLCIGPGAGLLRAFGGVPRSFLLWQLRWQRHAEHALAIQRRSAVLHFSDFYVCACLQSHFCFCVCVFTCIYLVILHSSVCRWWPVSHGRASYRPARSLVVRVESRHQQRISQPPLHSSRQQFFSFFISFNTSESIRSLPNVSYQFLKKILRKKKYRKGSKKKWFLKK